MTPIVQQRLIGSILLLCALCVIAFLLIDSASNNDDLTPDTKPELPFISSIDAIVDDGDIEIVESDHETLVELQQPAVDVRPVEVQSPPESTTVADDTAPLPIVDKPIKSATSSPTWSLQLASLADPAAAEAFRKKVELLGYNVTVVKAETQKGDRFRVRIGPEQDKLALEKVAIDIEKILNLKPLMLKQLP